MTAELKQRQTARPAPTSPAVRQHRKNLMRALEALQASAPALGLESAHGQFGASDALTNLIWKVKTIEYELGLHDQVVALAMQEDSAAEAAWRASIQELPAEDAIEGIARDSCPRLCVPGSYCVISNPCARSGSVCVHPVTQRHLWSRDETGLFHYPYEDNARSYEIHRAACRKLKVSPS
jgi:hypothetical protein